MSSHEVSEHVRAPTGAARPSAGGLSIADPVPVGIAGFGMTTFILSCINAGFFGGTTATPVVLGLAILYGGPGPASHGHVGLPQGRDVRRGRLSPPGR